MLLYCLPNSEKFCQQQPSGGEPDSVHDRGQERSGFHGVSGSGLSLRDEFACSAIASAISWAC